jgi:hypothetical protein
VGDWDFLAERKGGGIQDRSGGEDCPGRRRRLQAAWGAGGNSVGCGVQATVGAGGGQEGLDCGRQWVIEETV